MNKLSCLIESRLQYFMNQLRQVHSDAKVNYAVDCCFYNYSNTTALTLHDTDICPA